MSTVKTTVKAETASESKSKDSKTPSIEDVRKVLESQIAKFSYKSTLIENRDLFLKHKETLLAYKKDQGVDFDASLDSKSLKITLSDNNHYNRESAISISNNLIVRDFIDFTITKIDAKLLEIEKEILS